MKKIYTTLVIALLSINVFAQTPNWAWAENATGYLSEGGNSVATDSAGNIYVVGDFSGTLIIGSSTFNGGTVGDFYIAKYNAIGTILWAERFGGSEGEIARSVATDEAGNVYVTGSFDSPTITFGTTTLTNGGWGGGTPRYDMFIVKYDANGNVLWAHNAGGNRDDRGTSVATDRKGNVYVTGDFQSLNITFSTTTLTNAATTGYNSDIFVVKYDSTGTVVWAHGAGGIPNEYGIGVSTDTLGSVYITGEFTSPTITFGSTNLTSSGGNAQMYIVKYDSTGAVMWAKQSTGGSSTYIFAAPRIATDFAGNIIVTGSYAGTSIIFGSTTLTNVSSLPSQSDIFIVKYDKVGSKNSFLEI